MAEFTRGLAFRFWFRCVQQPVLQILQHHDYAGIFHLNGGQLFSPVGLVVDIAYNCHVHGITS